MKDDTARLLAANALLAKAAEEIDGVVRGRADFDDATRGLLGATVNIVQGYCPKSRGDALRWVQAWENGEEAWLILHAHDGQADARYHSALTREQRRLIARS